MYIWWYYVFFCILDVKDQIWKKILTLEAYNIQSNNYSHASAKNNKIFFLSTTFNEVSIKILPFKNGLDKKETSIFSIKFLPNAECNKLDIHFRIFVFDTYCTYFLLKFSATSKFPNDQTRIDGRLAEMWVVS